MFQSLTFYLVFYGAYANETMEFSNDNYYVIWEITFIGFVIDIS